MVMKVILALILLCYAAVAKDAKEEAPQHCAEWSGAECSWEPNLKKMKVDFGSRQVETFYAYVTDSPSSTTEGMYAKFSNLSPTPVSIYTWIGGKVELVGECEAFGSVGTTTYPGSKFQALSDKKVLESWTTLKDQSNYYYDPYRSSRAAAKALPAEQVPLWQMQAHNKVFAEQYKKFTNSEWLALYKQKRPPQYHMWRADAVDDTFYVESKQIQFIELPEEAELKRGMSVYGPRPDEKERMRRHRHRDPLLNMTVRVLSVTPRVFEIENFLSPVEMDHIQMLSYATMTDDEQERGHAKIPRSEDFITDAIYARAADAFQMDEALLRFRHPNELPEFKDSSITVAEKLHVLNYKEGQDYALHADFSMPGLVNLQPSRFATMILYLNDDFKGGETWFPKASPKPLTVKPKKGKAVFFYNMLPDGNLDERSLHAGLPVTQGEKWMANLWVWDPVLDHTRADHI
jgi:prolyl 4-hydroxylase